MDNFFRLFDFSDLSTKRLKITGVLLASAGLLILTVLLILLIVRKMKAREVFHMNAEDMDGLEFEEYCGELLQKNGFSDVEITQATRDFGVDLFAEKAGISYAFQCKLYDRPVGTKAVQEIYAGRDFYHSMVGAVITNQRFTAEAKKLAEALNILLWDGEELRALENRAAEVHR